MFASTARQKGDVGRTLPGHERILAAIRARRPNAARLAVRRLLDGTSRIVDRIQGAGRRAKRRGRSAPPSDS
jgi:DNA-binding FadR family transcriptional regulator